MSKVDLLVALGLWLLVITVTAMFTAVGFGLVRFAEWRHEKRVGAAQAELDAASVRAKELADDLRIRSLHARGLEMTGPIALVKTTRRGRSKSDQGIAAANEVLREVDS